MSFRPAVLVLVASSLLCTAIGPAEAQRQKFKLGGGAGFAALSNPDVEHGSTAAVGGFFGLRFNDNISLETNAYFMRSNRVFNAAGVPVDQTPDTPAFRFETTRYHLDGTFVLNLGRRQPFHPFVLAGAGIVRRDDKRTDLTFEVNPDTGQPVLATSEVVLNETMYEAAGHIGAGAEIYFMYNLAARAEFRLWVPQTWEKRDRMFFFAASYYF